MSKVFRPFWAESIIQYEVYHSSRNYNSQGKSEGIPNSEGFLEAKSYSYLGRFVFNSQWAGSFELNSVEAQANSLTETKYNSGLQALSGGFEYKFNLSAITLALEVLGQYSIYKVNENSTKPIYGDGSSNLGANLWLISRNNQFQFTAMGGFLSRSEGLSTLAPYLLGLQWKMGDWVLGASIDGVFSIIEDTSTESVRHNLLTQTNSGSLYYRSYNPDVHFLNLDVKWNLTKQISLNAGTGNTFLGRNASEGTRYFVNLDIHWQVQTPEKENNFLKHSIPSSKKNNDGSGDSI